MLPIYLVIGLINVLAKTNNYGIKIDDPEMDIRVRRDVLNTDTSSMMLNHLLKRPTEKFVREKRQFSFFYPKKTAKPTTTTPKYNYNNVIPRQHYANRNNNNGKLDYNFVTQNNGMLRNNGRLLSYSAPTNYYNQNNHNSWNASNARQNNLRNNGTYIRNNVTGFYEYRYNNIPVNYSNSYNGFPITRPYPSKATLMPKFNTSGRKYNGTVNISSNDTPIYNYQDPNLSNFSGYVEHNINRPVNSTYEYSTIRPYLPIPTLKPSNASTYWYNDFNSTPAPFQNATGGRTNSSGIETTTKIDIACVICNIGCAANYHRVGWSCEPDDAPDY